MNTNHIKIRKENFGWIACDIKTCNVYELTDVAAKVIILLKKYLSEEEIVLNLIHEYNINKDEASNIFSSINNFLLSINK